MIGRRYEWRDTGHGPQLWSLERECWALWYGIGAIGIADSVKAEIEAALNPCWGAADEALCAAREMADDLASRVEVLEGDLAHHRETLRGVIDSYAGSDGDLLAWLREREPWLFDEAANVPRCSICHVIYSACRCNPITMNPVKDDR